MDTWYERLTTLDSLFLELEDRSAHMHVGAVAVFEGPPPPYRDLLRLIEARLESVPRYRQRIMFVPLKQGRPVWVDETQFDLEYHVRHTALPAPGGEPELQKLAGRLFSQALDRDKPLWELWLVEGLDQQQGTDSKSFPLYQVNTAGTTEPVWTPDQLDGIVALEHQGSRLPPDSTNELYAAESSPPAPQAANPGPVPAYRGNEGVSQQQKQ